MDEGFKLGAINHVGVVVPDMTEPKTLARHNTPVVFFHPGDAGGVLIELMETHRES